MTNNYYPGGRGGYHSISKGHRKYELSVLYISLATFVILTINHSPIGLWNFPYNIEKYLPSTVSDIGNEELVWTKFPTIATATTETPDQASE